MKVTSITSESTPDVVSFSDKVMGEFETHADLDTFARDLDNLEIGTIEVLEGESGQAYLRQVRKSVTGFLDYMLGDLESEMLREYEHAAAQGHVIFAVPNPQ